MDFIHQPGLGIHSTNARPASQPTSTLPSLSHLATYTPEQVMRSLQSLHRLYFPTEPALFHLPEKLLSITRPTIPRPTYDMSIPDSGYASAEEDDDGQNFLADTDFFGEDTEEELLRADPFERSFTIKWLTGFIGRSDNWITACDSESDSEERSNILDQAITLLSAFTSTDEETETALTRTFSFPLTTGSTKKQIHVELNDAPLSKEDHTSVGLQSWGSSILLAERICLQPSFFSLTAPTNASDRPLRILELGAGTGMLSIVAAKILLHPQGPAPEIIATDYHPDVLDNLTKNIATNFPKYPATITIKCLDWEVPHYSEPLDRPFDIILAADVIYHPEHARWIKQCVEKLLVEPSHSTASPIRNDGGVFWLIIPVRSTGRHEGLDRTVDDLFPTHTHGHVEATKNAEPQLVILEKDEVGRQGSVGRADEGGYKLFKIGWIR